MTNPEIVSRDDWTTARVALLEKEKAFTRLRDELSAERRALPWEKVETDYVFDGPTGRERLADLFDGRRQLIIYHFMFGPDWDEGCPSCSYLADHFDPAIAHLNQRDVSMVAVSRTTLDKIDAFKARMGWRFKWVSSLSNDFNRDYQVSFTPEEQERGEMTYNYRVQRFPSNEAPGVSVFAMGDGKAGEDGSIYHTYSSFGRGLDMFISTYHYLDIVPKGRDEDRLDWPMQWIRHHDKYGT